MIRETGAVSKSLAARVTPPIPSYEQAKAASHRLLPYGGTPRRSQATSNITESCLSNGAPVVRNVKRWQGGHPSLAGSPPVSSKWRGNSGR